MIIPNSPLTSRQEATILTTGYVAVLFIGVLATIALCFAALLALAMFGLVCLQALVSVSQAIGATFSAADPLVRFLILVFLSYVAYRAGRFILKKRGNQ